MAEGQRWVGVAQGGDANRVEAGVVQPFRVVVVVAEDQDSLSWAVPDVEDQTRRKHRTTTDSHLFVRSRSPDGLSRLGTAPVALVRPQSPACRRGRSHPRRPMAPSTPRTITGGTRNPTGIVLRNGGVSARGGPRWPLRSRRGHPTTRRETAAPESRGEGPRSGGWPRRRRSCRRPPTRRRSQRGCATQGRRTAPGWVRRRSAAVAGSSGAHASPAGLASRANASLTPSSRWPAISRMAGPRLPPRSRSSAKRCCTALSS